MTFLLANWRLVLLAVLLGVIGVQTWRLDRSQAEFKALEASFEQFKGSVRALGEKAKADVALQQAKDNERKAKSDAENSKTRRDLSGVYAAYRSLRDSRSSGGGGLSAPGHAPGDPSRTCFDSAKFGAALRRLDEGVLGIAETGDQAIADLDSARRWAQGR